MLAIRPPVQYNTGRQIQRLFTIHELIYEVRYHMFLDLISRKNDYRLDIIADIISHGRDLWFLGCGEFARHAKVVMDLYHVPIKGCCVDDEFFLEGEMFNGMPVEKLSTVLAAPDNKAILICIFSNELGNNTKKRLLSTLPAYYCDDWYNWFQMDYSFVLKNAARYEWLYSHFGDQLSGDVLIAFIQAHLTGDGTYLTSLRGNKNHQYDYELLNISPMDNMLDCGAYIGDTIHNVSSYLSELPSRIIAFEPDEKNLRILRSRYQDKIDAGRIEIIPYGCGENNQFMKFYSVNGGDSFFAASSSEAQTMWNDGQEASEVQLIRIDDVIGDQPVSWIKMDIEGGELGALKGARETLIRNKPRLSICVYHRIDDLITIPMYLNSLSSEGVHYSYYLRHHGKSMSDTVLYALPEQGEGNTDHISTGGQ